MQRISKSVQMDRKFYIIIIGKIWGQGAARFVATKATTFFIKSTIILLDILNIRKVFKKYKQENECLTENKLNHANKILNRYYGYTVHIVMLKRKD